MHRLGNRQKRGFSLAEALAMTIIAGMCLVPIIGTLNSGLARTKGLELRSAMQNLAESSMNEILNKALVAGETPDTFFEIRDYPSVTDPQYQFALRVEILPGVIASGAGNLNPSIQGALHPDARAVSIEVGHLATEPLVASVTLFSLVCPPPPVPDRIWVACPPQKTVYSINPFTHDLIDQGTLSGAGYVRHLAVHPNGRWLATKSRDKIHLVGIDPAAGSYGIFTEVYVSPTNITDPIDTNADEAETGLNFAALDRGFAFRSDGKYFYLTSHTDKKLYVLQVPDSSTLPAPFTTVTSFALNSFDSVDMTMLEDGTLLVAQRGANGNTIFGLNTHTHQPFTLPTSSVNQYAVAGTSDGRQVISRVAPSTLATIDPTTPTNSSGGTLLNLFAPAANDSNFDMVVTPDDRWVLFGDAFTGSNADKGIKAIRLPLNVTTLAANDRLWNTTGNRDTGYAITEVQPSCFRGEVIFKGTPYNTGGGIYGHELHFVSWRSLVAGAYVSTPVPTQTFGFKISDIEARLAEYAYVACTNGASHTIKCLDLYGGGSSIGLWNTLKDTFPGSAPNHIALTAGGDRAVVSLAATGKAPANFDTVIDDLGSFSPNLTYPATTTASRAVYLQDRSLLVLTQDLTCDCKFWGMPPGSVVVASHVNGFLLYEADTMGNLIAAPKLSLGLDYNAGWRVKDVVTTHRSPGAYVLWGNDNATGAVLAWIASSTEPGFNGGTSNFRVLGLWNGQYEGFPEGRPSRMALSRDDTLLALYDPAGVTSKQVVRLYDLTNSKLPVQTGMNLLQYRDGNHNGNSNALTTFYDLPPPRSPPDQNEANHNRKQRLGPSLLRRLARILQWDHRLFDPLGVSLPFRILVPFAGFQFRQPNLRRLPFRRGRRLFRPQFLVRGPCRQQHPLAG